MKAWGAANERVFTDTICWGEKGGGTRGELNDCEEDKRHDVLIYYS
jgi:hypothetical protein